MSFFKSLWFGKAQTDPQLQAFEKDLNELSEQMEEVKGKFSVYLNTVNNLSQAGSDLGESIVRFNARLRPTHVPVSAFARVQAHFRDQVRGTWARQYRDEVLYMFDHWQKYVYTNVV